MKKTTTKKLTLSRNTIAALELPAAQLGAVAGGGFSAAWTCSMAIQCKQK